MNRTAITGQFRHPQPIKCYDEVRYRIVVQTKGTCLLFKTGKWRKVYCQSAKIWLRWFVMVKLIVTFCLAPSSRIFSLQQHSINAKKRFISFFVMQLAGVYNYLSADLFLDNYYFIDKKAFFIYFLLFFSSLTTMSLITKRDWFLNRNLFKSY